MSEVFEHDALEVVERAEARMQMDDDFAGAASAAPLLRSLVLPSWSVYPAVTACSSSVLHCAAGVGSNGLGFKLAAA